MADKSAIEWTDATWNPIRGCSVISPGCKNCYAMKTGHRFNGKGGAYEGLTQLTSNGPVWTGKVKFAEEHLLDPLKWKEPRRIFVNSMSDLFHEGVSDEQIDKIFAVMALCRQHTFQILTKRPERMLAWFNRPDEPGHTKTIRNPCASYVWRQAVPIQITITERRRPICDFHWTDFAENDSIAPWPLPNVWLGVSCENQKAADERIPLLLQTPAAVRWLSIEPLLSPITFRWARWDHHQPHQRRLNQLPDVERGGKLIAGSVDHLDGLRMIDWVVAGGESGPKARPMQPDWARSLRDQCKAAGVPFFFKQWGEWMPESDNSPDHTEAHHALTRGGVLINASQAVTSKGDEIIFKVGKKAAGRLLDGVEHNEYPEAAR